VQQFYPLIAAAQADLDSAEGQALTAAGGFDPTARVRGSFTPTGPYTYGYFDATVEQPTSLWGSSFFVGYRLGQPMQPWGVGSAEVPVYDGRLLTNEGGEVRAGVTVPLWRDGPIDRRRAELARTAAGIRVAQSSVLAQRIDAEKLASYRYWDWVFAGERLNIAQELLRIARVRDSQFAQRAAAGDIANIEQLDNARTVQARVNATVAATRALEQASIELSLYLRDSAGRPLMPQAARLPVGALAPRVVDTSDAALQQAINLALAQRPELERFNAQQSQADVELRVAQNQLAPSIQVSAQIAQDIGTQSAVRARTELSAGVSVEIPIPNRGAQGRIQSASAAITRVQQQLRLMRDRVVADVRDAFSALRAADQRMQSASIELALAERVEQGERQRFENGDSTILLLNLREIASAEARLKLKEAQADRHRAWAMLLAATGRHSAAM
jgi:outer membrane protein TolC